MALRIERIEDGKGGLDIFSGAFRVGTVRPIAIGEHGATRFVWVISGVTIGGQASGPADTLDGAVQGLVDRWRNWLSDAELAETNGRSDA